MSAKGNYSPAVPGLAGGTTTFGGTGKINLIGLAFRLCPLYYNPDVVNVTDYYPFDMPMRGGSIGLGLPGATQSGSDTVNGYTVPVDMTLTSRTSAQPVEYVASNAVEFTGEFNSLPNDEFSAYIADASYAGTGNQNTGGSGGGFASNPYRYGFNGQEHSDEIKGEGNSYTAEFWEYDPRIGRRWNIDPVVFPSFSPYSTNFCNPISFSDPNGDVGGRHESKRAYEDKLKNNDYENVRRYEKDGIWHVTYNIKGDAREAHGDARAGHLKFGRAADNSQDGWIRDIQTTADDLINFGLPKWVAREVEATNKGGDYALKNSKFIQVGAELSNVAAHMNLGVGVYEAFTGENALNGEQMSGGGRTMSLVGSIPFGGVYIRIEMQGLKYLAYVGKATEFVRRYSKSFAKSSYLEPVLKIATENRILQAIEQHAYDYLSKVKGLALGNINKPLDKKKYQAVYDNVAKEMGPQLQKMFKEIDEWLLKNSDKLN